MMSDVDNTQQPQPEFETSKNEAFDESQSPEPTNLGDTDPGPLPESYQEPETTTGPEIINPTIQVVLTDNGVEVQVSHDIPDVLVIGALELAKATILTQK